MASGRTVKGTSQSSYPVDLLALTYPLPECSIRPSCEGSLRPRIRLSDAQKGSQPIGMDDLLKNLYGPLSLVGASIGKLCVSHR